MERLSLLDAQFLHLEDRRSPMHIACVCVLSGAVPSEDELRRLFLSKLPNTPLYRQRVRFLPLELGRPVWLDDVHFDLAYHLRRTALPAPGDDAALCTLFGRLMSQRLDRERPLWEFWVLEGLSDQRWAFVLKIHHSMVDGVSGIDLLGALLDREQDVALPEPPAWTPAPEPSKRELVEDAWSGLASDAGDWLHKLEQGLAEPRVALRGALETGAGLLQFAKRLTLTPGLSIEGRVCGQRNYAHASAPLESIRTIRKQLGGTLNDVVLAAIAGAYRTYLGQRGDDANRAVLRTLVPVSVRNPTAHGKIDNRVSAVLCQLPVQLANPVERLKAVSAQMVELKTSHMAEAGEWLVELGNLAPPMVVGAISRFVARTMHQLPQKSINTVTTNVPGPPQVLYCLGRRLLDIWPYVPITQGLRTGTAILSYHDHITFGVTGDYDSTGSDLTQLARAMAHEIGELAACARSPQRPDASTGDQRKPVPRGARMPVAFIPHGGGPWPFVELGFASQREVDALAGYLRSLSSLTPTRPRALLVVSAHWEEAVPTVMTAEQPPMLYDYYGFPPESYQLTWPAAGEPSVAARVHELLRGAGFASASNATRGFDHGTFVPLKVAYPAADVPTVQLSLRRDLDPTEHIAIGRALAPLRDEGVFIVGSGMSYHNMRGFRGAGRADADKFDAWLRGAATAAPAERTRLLSTWSSAPAARAAHPREEHLLPLMVIAGAAGEDQGRTAYNDTFAEVRISAFHYG